MGRGALVAARLWRNGRQPGGRLEKHCAGEREPGDHSPEQRWMGRKALTLAERRSLRDSASCYSGADFKHGPVPRRGERRRSRKKPATVGLGRRCGGGIGGGSL